MSRARTTDDDEEVIVPKKPRARKAPVIFSDDSEERDKPKSRARKPRVVVSEVVSVESESTRKAPTPIAALRTKKNRSVRSFFVMIIFCVLMAGAGVAIGLLDTGPINVVAVVNERNEKINRGEVRDEKTGEPLTQTIPVQGSDARPNGGLQIADPIELPSVPVPTTDVSSTTATSTETTATTSSEAEVPTE